MEKEGEIKKRIQLHQVALDHSMNDDEWCFCRQILKEREKKWINRDSKGSNGSEMNQMLLHEFNAMITISN